MALPKSVLRLGFAITLAFLCTTASGAATISIADARDEPLGTVVTVQGVVTVPAGAYVSSTFDQGFAIQDSSAGIYVSIALNPGLNLHQRVRVTGALDDDGFGQLVVRPASLDDIETLFGLGFVAPQPVATGDVSEATEGLLIKVTGTVTRPVGDDTPFGYSVFIDDGSGETQVFIPVATGVNPFRLSFVELGEEITAVGLGAQFLAQYEVLPRKRTDMRRWP